MIFFVRFLTVSRWRNGRCPSVKSGAYFFAGDGKKTFTLVSLEMSSNQEKPNKTSLSPPNNGRIGGTYNSLKLFL